MYLEKLLKNNLKTTTYYNTTPQTENMPTTTKTTLQMEAFKSKGISALESLTKAEATSLNLGVNPS